MAYNTKLVNSVREHLTEFPDLQIEEKKMFGGLAFMINGKMCINVSGENLMCRFDPSVQGEIEKRAGYQKMVIKGRKYKGYCYVNAEGYKKIDEFDF